MNNIISHRKIKHNNMERRKVYRENILSLIYYFKFNEYPYSLVYMFNSNDMEVLKLLNNKFYFPLIFFRSVMVQIEVTI